jgi:transglutaminase-like putative cysteine protease
MPEFLIRHVTTYRYANPVRLGLHRLMFRPRGSHDMRVLDTRLAIRPAAKSVRWMHDVFGNSVALVDFADAAATELVFESDILVAHYGLDAPACPVADYARTYPFSYAVEDLPDLGRTIERHYPDPDHLVDGWVKQFLVGAALVETLPLLERMTVAVKDSFAYRARDAEGTQSPTETLSRGQGSCRDFALFLMEAVRSLGFAARFVSGYLYDPSVDGASAGTVGAGATHAWVEIYLPGAGWVEFDPTNGIIGGKNLIRVAVTRDPAQAVPVAGKWFGAASDFLGLWVEVKVTSQHRGKLPG